MDHSAWDSLLQEFVNEEYRVDYGRLRQQGMERLEGYLALLGEQPIDVLPPNGRKALLINAYNAFTVHWIAKNYPVPSIWSTPNPFEEPRHLLGGERLSLDEIESQLQQMGDPRFHAALVCAARSCPPLRREAYVAERIDEQLDDNTRRWLTQPSLNEFHPAEARAEVSAIFKWYRQDFDSYPGELEGFLRDYGPREKIAALGDKKLTVSFKSYDWGLNDQADLGANYSFFRFLWDAFKNWFR